MQLNFVNASTTIPIPIPFPFPITPRLVDSPLEALLSHSYHFVTQIEVIWRVVRRMAIAPLLQLAVIVCLAMSVVLLIDIAAMGAVSLAVKFLGRRPERRYKWEPMSGDLEQGSIAYPMVLVQIPMYNEKEVYRLSIGAACALSWPSDRIFVQILDDSTDPTVKDLVRLECKIWASKGKNIFYEVRDNRKGYKAGALKKGMEYSYAQKCDFVAIFDADFQPEPDFLMRMIPFLMYNPKIGLVQARWQFVNPNECLMTRIQRMTLDYHFKVEQEAGSSIFSFFGFNGTAGVWRISAINEAGGWKDRTTVEDMDLAVRACLKGWQFVYVGDVKVKSELPSTLKAYRNQQHRWTCGAANLFRKMSKEILATKEVSIWRKFYLLYSFFFVRKVVAHLVTFFLYCVVVPVSVLVPEVSVPIWGVAYIPTTITLLNAIRNPRLIHFIPFWILFENVMSMHRMKATLIGLFETGRVNEWVVTEKLGDATSTKPEPQILEKPSFRLRARIKLSEIGFAVFLFFCACCDIFYGGNYYFVYIYLQSISFLVVGLGYVGKFVSNS
ncbi:hypothetical protein LUZ61_004274 [Rhynchospora tenuis]|uniref:glucomannan 4-beta-mannosyltransferase n=1 Tax=Rhynchospora tenuis TaxID=198213 RepID=A0AAD6ETK2_9POAL|nr:hypothetical protein LUZ61_004274 [Rhynchospora tenuis]